MASILRQNKSTIKQTPLPVSSVRALNSKDITWVNLILGAERKIVEIINLVNELDEQAAKTIEAQSIEFFDPISERKTKGVFRSILDQRLVDEFDKFNKLSDSKVSFSNSSGTLTQFLLNVHTDCINFYIQNKAYEKGMLNTYVWYVAPVVDDEMKNELDHIDEFVNSLDENASKNYLLDFNEINTKLDLKINGQSESGIIFVMVNLNQIYVSTIKVLMSNQELTKYKIVYKDAIETTIKQFERTKANKIFIDYIVKHSEIANELQASISKFILGLKAFIN